MWRRHFRDARKCHGAEVTDWLCWHVGTVTDPKFTAVAKRSSVSRGFVLAIWAYLLERAKTGGSPGEFGDLDLEDMALVVDLPEDQISAVLVAMEAKGLLSSGSIRNWSKRQHKTSTERVQKFREKRKERAESTRNAETNETVSETSETVSETHRNDETRQTDRQTDSSEAKASGESPNSEIDLSLPVNLGRISVQVNGEVNSALDPAKELFDAGVKILTANATPERQARALIGKWRKAVKNDGKLLGILLDAGRDHKVDLVAYLTKAVEAAEPRTGMFA
jgi:hypothetical protein